jgi:hypothetical protein
LVQKGIRELQMLKVRCKVLELRMRENIQKRKARKRSEELLRNNRGHTGMRLRGEGLRALVITSGRKGTLEQTLIPITEANGHKSILPD